MCVSRVCVVSLNTIVEAHAMCVCVCLCVCVSVYLCVCVSVCLCVHGKRAYYSFLQPANDHGVHRFDSDVLGFIVQDLGFRDFKTQHPLKT